MRRVALILAPLALAVTYDGDTADGAEPVTVDGRSLSIAVRPAGRGG